MIENMAERIALTIKRANEQQTVSVDIMKFSLIILLNTTLIIILIFVGGLVMGTLPETFLAFLAFAGLRIVSGGFHFKSAVHCTVASALLFVAIPHISISENINMVLMGVSSILVLLFSPSNIEGHSRINKKHYPILRLLSLLIIASNLLWMNPVVTKAFFVQALLLIRWRR